MKWGTPIDEYLFVQASSGSDMKGPNLQKAPQIGNFEVQFLVVQSDYSPPEYEMMIIKIQTSKIWGYQKWLWAYSHESEGITPAEEWSCKPRTECHWGALGEGVGDCPIPCVLAELSAGCSPPRWPSSCESPYIVVEGYILWIAGVIYGVIFSQSLWRQCFVISPFLLLKIPQWLKSPSLSLKSPKSPKISKRTPHQLSN